MLLTRELWRLLTSVVGFTFSTGRIVLVLTLIAVMVVALVATSVTVIGPVALYPFL